MEQKIKVFDREKNAYYSVTVECNINSGRGVVGAYGYSSYDVGWSGVRTTTPAYYETTDTMAIEVYNVSGYNISSVRNGERCTNISGPTSMSGGKYWTFKITGNARIVVNYTSAPVTKYKVTTLVASGSGRISGAGEYNSGSSVTISATPSTNYALNYIVDTGTGGHVSNPYTFNIYSNKSFSAYFYKAKSAITTSVSPSGAGTVSGGGNINIGTTTYLIAYANEGYVFDHWNIDGTNYDTATVPYTVTEKDITAIAYFKVKKCVVNVIRTPIEGGSVTGGGEYDYNTNVPITSTANLGYKLDYWELNGEVYTTETSFTYNAKNNATFIAHFIRIGYVVRINNTPSDYTAELHQYNILTPSVVYDREHVWHTGDTVIMKAVDELSSKYRFAWWDNDPMPWEPNPIKGITIGEQDETHTAHYILKDAWRVNLIIPQSDIYKDLDALITANGAVESLGNKNYKMYENSNVQLMCQMRNNKYVFDHWEWVDSEGNIQLGTSNPMTIVTPKINERGGPIFANATIRCVVRQREITPRTLDLHVYPNNCLGYVNVQYIYYDDEGERHFEVYTARANSPIHVDIQDGGQLNIFAIGVKGEDTDWTLDYWSGDIDIDRKYYTNQLIFVNKNLNINANFITAFTIQAIPVPTNGGYITADAPAVQVSDNVYRIGLGQKLVLRATPWSGSGFTFSHWTLDGQMGPTTPVYTINSMTRQDYSTFKAYFRGGEDFVTLTVNSVPVEGGYVTIDYIEQSSITKRKNDTAKIKAYANPGYRFVKWLTGETRDELTITMDQDLSYTAIFELDTPPPPQEDFDILFWFGSKKKRLNKRIVIK